MSIRMLKILEFVPRDFLGERRDPDTALGESVPITVYSGKSRVHVLQVLPQGLLDIPFLAVHNSLLIQHHRIQLV